MPPQSPPGHLSAMASFLARMTCGQVLTSDFPQEVAFGRNYQGGDDHSNDNHGNEPLLPRSKKDWKWGRRKETHVFLLSARNNGRFKQQHRPNFAVRVNMSCFGVCLQRWGFLLEAKVSYSLQEGSKPVSLRCCSLWGVFPSSSVSIELS